MAFSTPPAKRTSISEWVWQPCLRIYDALSPPSSDQIVTGKKAREREQKWLKMLDNWDEWMSKRQPKVCSMHLARGNFLTLE